jgi:peptide chain release factor 1
MPDAPSSPAPTPAPTPVDLPPAARARLDALAAEFDLLGARLADPGVLADHRAVRDTSMKRSALEPLVTDYRALLATAADLADLRETAGSRADPDLAALAREEIPGAEARLAALLSSVKKRLVTSDDQAVGSVILELRAGTGGDEATLWTRDLLDMYTKLAARRSWQVETLELTSEAHVGGIRSAVLNVKGPGVWSALAFEAGVHSVKRVPATEAQGRVHTSTASVAVLPEPEDVQVKIDWARDVDEGATRAQGPGGQNVNKVETAWQIHHKPTGIIIKMMEAKSQSQNRERARRLLLARLYEIERQKVHADRSAARSAQIGSADRSEKIRTYRYKDGIAADERLPGEYALRDLLAGNLDQLLADLAEQDVQRRLAAL